MRSRMSARTSARKFVRRSSHTELGRQRELKLRAQIEKQDAMITRYKERAVHMSKAQLQQRAFDEAQEKRHKAEEEAKAHAERCAELTQELDERQAMLDEARSMAELMQRNLRALAQTASALLQARPTPASPKTMVREVVIDRAAADVQAHLAATLAQRDALMDELKDAEERAQSLQAHCDALEELAAHHDEDADLDAERIARSRLAEQCATQDATLFESKWHSAEDRCAWLEAQLAHTHAVHSKVLSALRAQERGKTQEAQASAAELTAELHQAKKQVAHLQDELERVAWYEEAYAQRSRQADLLTEIAALADEDAQSKHFDSLTAHIDVLHCELETLRTKRDALEEQTVQWQRGLEPFAEAQPAKRRRAASDAGKYASLERAPSPRPHAPAHARRHALPFVKDA